MKHLKFIYLTAVCSFMAVMLRADVSKLYTSDRLTSSLIDCVIQDKYGYLWIGTEYGLNKFDGYRFTNYLSSKDDTTTIVDNEVVRLLSDSQGRLWIGSSYGLSRYDYEHDCFKRYTIPDKVTPRVNSILEISNGDILLGTAGYGLYSIRKGTDYVTKETEFWKRKMEGFYSRIFEDDQHHLWRSSHLSTFTRITMKDHKVLELKDFESPYGPPMSFLRTDNRSFLIVCHRGILRYDYATGSLNDAGFDLSVLGQKVSIHKAIQDHLGNLYFGSAGGGLLMIPHGSNVMRTVENNNGEFSLGSSNINDIFEDKDHNLWVCCYKKGLFQMNQRQEIFTPWSFSKQHQIIGNSVSSMTLDDHENILATVQNTGVFLFNAEGQINALPSSPAGTNTLYKDGQGKYWLCTENTLNAYNPKTGVSVPRAFMEGWGLNCMADDGRGTLFICNFGKGLYVYDTNTNEMVSYNMNQTDRPLGYLCNDWIKSLYYDSRGLLWIGTSNGLSCFNPATKSFKSLGWNVQLEKMQCTAFNETNDGNILIGTHAGLYIYNRDKNAISPFPHSETLNDKLIYGIVTDQKGDLWLSTSMGIWQYEQKEQRFIGFINGNGLTTKEYVLGAVVHRSDDMIGFGNSDGVTTFYPEAVKRNKMEIGEVFLTNFIIGGKAVSPLSEKFTIPYDENSFTMEFSLLTFKNMENISYEYRINGSKEWTPAPNGSNAFSFNKMKPGRYIFEVRAESNGVYSKATRSFTVVVKEPWYASTFAYLFYGLLLAAALVMAIVYYDRQRKAELEESKMRFLINATHDIRSPLTLIMGPLEKLKKRISDEESKTDIETIDRNAQRLMLLVNQILDERKIDKNQMKLHCRETEMVKFINGICTLYQYNAQERNIHFVFRHDGISRLMAWIDRTNFDKVVSNLLSNALKYTFDGGTVDVILQKEENFFVLSVEDNGIGIKEENKDKLFDRFYQGDNVRDLHIEGTGIGLNLCRALVNMHGGEITADNRTDGTQGSVFKVRIPLGNAHLKPEEIEEHESPLFSSNPNKQATRNFRILIADDDQEIASYIREELGAWYRFDAAPNGKEALKALLMGKYDLVISDVLMPEMDGITLLKHIKANTNISDIPVILLTSKTEVDDRLEGLKRGADAYLSKPFNMDELHILIDNLIDNVRRLRGKFSGAQKQEEKLEKVEVRGNNDALMERVMKKINENLNDPDFNVERLTEQVGISRAQLHRKMKEITGIPTGDFIRNLRLEEAARLIREKKINVTQVAYAVGFNNQTHFSTVFKRHFGVTPSEYAEQYK